MSTSAETGPLEIPRLDKAPCAHIVVNSDGGYAGECQQCHEVMRATTKGWVSTGRIAAYDDVERPRHYNSRRIECWDYIVDQDMGYLDGCVVKYVTRYRLKGTPLKDLKKARAYLDRLIRLVEEQEA